MGQIRDEPFQGQVILVGLFQFVHEKRMVHALKSSRIICIYSVRLISIRYGLPRRLKVNGKVSNARPPGNKTVLLVAQGR